MSINVGRSEDGTHAKLTAPCYTAQLRVTCGPGGIWNISLHSFGRKRKPRTLVFLTSHEAKAPRIDPSVGDSDALLWLGAGCVDIPQKLVPELQAFIDEHAKAGAA